LKISGKTKEQLVEDNFPDPSWDSESRFSKLLRYFNMLLKKTNKEARKRHIYLSVAKFVPISTNVRIIATLIKLRSQFPDFSQAVFIFFSLTV